MRRSEIASYNPLEAIQNRSPHECSAWTDEEWYQAHEELAHLPYLAREGIKLANSITTPVSDVEDIRGVKRQFNWEEEIDTHAIVRAPSFESWSTHYHAPKTKASIEKGESSVVEIGRKIANAANKTLKESGSQDASAILSRLDKVFWEGSFAVRLDRINGPRGPIFLVDDGSHRVASAKLVGLGKIKAMVRGTTPSHETDLIWFEALSIMKEEARDELLRIYDLIYPPTPETEEKEAALQVEAHQRQDELKQLFYEKRIRRQRELIQEALAHREEQQLFHRARQINKALAGNPEFKKIRNEQALARIKELDGSLFPSIYREELSSDGYLVRPDGTKDFHVIEFDCGPKHFDAVLVRTIEEYYRSDPDTIDKIEEGVELIYVEEIEELRAILEELA